MYHSQAQLGGAIDRKGMMIALEDVTFAFPHQPPILDGFSWSVSRGDVWTVLGPSACGKSTLLLLLAGLLHPQRGVITVGGQPIRRPRPGTGLVLQEYGLLPWATVRENVSLGLRIRRFYGPDGRHAPPEADGDPVVAAERIDQWLARLDIAAVAQQYPGQISGGQRQRTALARALVLQPDLMLMDEPFSALDAPTREALQDLTLDLCAEEGLTVVMVTHRIEEAAYMGQQVLVMRQPPNRAGRAVDNAHAQSASYRGSSGYQAACIALREALEGP
jgi:NitT/TauT family transport system ATP-binding protein